MNEAVDHEARNKAALVQQAQQAHEDRCEERWAESRKITEMVLGEVKSIRATMEEAKGGWRLLLIMGGAAATVATGVTWISQHLRFGM